MKVSIIKKQLKLIANAIITKVAVTIKTQSSTSNAHNATILLSSANIVTEKAIINTKIKKNV